MSRNDGGPAFPANSSELLKSESGMTLLDYFEGKWLTGYVANPNTPNLSREEAAELAYRMADAMIKERNK